MKKLTTVLTVLILTLALWAGSAFAYTIKDNYWGADDHDYYGDVIGRDSLFDIDRMDVDLAGDILSVTIWTNFANNPDAVGSFGSATYNGNGIGYGDLFLASLWTPYDVTNNNEPYEQDDSSPGHGTKWTYAFSLENNRWMDPSPGSTNSGTFKIFSLEGDKNTDDILLTQDFISRPAFRNGQEVAVNLDSVNVHEIGSGGVWEIGGNIGYGYIRFEANISETNLLNGPEIALHWGETCGNDVIEGSAPVPEPATMMLLGVGLIGMVGLRRKKLLKR